jgi:hypothetical protein
MREQRPPWDARLINWMQESARHKDRSPRGPIRRGEFIRLSLALLALGAFWAATGVDTWPVVAGLGGGLGVRLWRSRPDRKGPGIGPEPG